MGKIFKNLYDFFNYMEFCPLCRSRLVPTAKIFDITNCTISNRYLSVYNYDFPERKISIDLLTNNVLKPNYFPISLTNASLIVGSQCNKYHFFYSGIMDIQKDSNKFSDICLDKYHFLYRRNEDSFSVNGSIVQDMTTVKITSNCNTREIISKYINFDFSSKKKIDTKLKNIELLG